MPMMFRDTRWFSLWRYLLSTLLYHGVALVIAGIFVLPLLWMVANSLRQPGLPPSPTIEWWPTPPAWANYREIFQIVPLAGYIRSSVWVGVWGVLITVVTASWTGFAIAQLPPVSRRWLVTLAVLLMMAPSSALWLARFVIFKQLGLIDSYGALIAPSIMGTSASFILLFYWTFRRVPLELFESARLDGAEAFHSWWALGLPLARPTLVAVSVLTFMHYWSDFIDPLLYLKSESRYTLAIGLRILQQLDMTNWPLLMAGSAVMTMPVVVSYLFVQRFAWMEGRLAGLVR